MSETPKRPSVRVPVLFVKHHHIQVFCPFKSGPVPDEQSFLAAMAVDTATTKGTARPRAWGQVITITVTIRSREKQIPLPAKSQAPSVMPPAVRAMMVSQKSGTVGRVLGL